MMLYSLLREICSQFDFCTFYDMIIMVIKVLFMEKFLILLKKKRLLFSIESNFIRRTSFGFTLAEMLVVMLILTIVLAAFAPLMTKRKVVENTTPWRYAANNSDIYYGLAASQTAMIGQNTKEEDDGSSRLIINTANSNQSHISFKQSGNKRGHLRISSNSLTLGTENTSSGTSSENSVVGVNAFSSNYGTGNTVFGNQALRYGSSSNYNTTIGWGANYGGGSNNVAVGYKSIYAGSSSSNSAVGYSSMERLNGGSSNSALGYASLRYTTTGTYNTAIGRESMLNNTTGHYNSAVGSLALSNNTSGYQNSALGYKACQYLSGVSDHNVTCVGANSGPDSGKSVSNVVYIGKSTDTVYIPGRVIIEGTLDVNNTMHVGARGSMWDLKMRLGDNTTAVTISGTGPGEVKHQRDWQALTDYRGTYSDRRLKNITNENTLGLAKIRQLKVYDFTFKNDKDKKPQVGVIAQDLQKVFPDAVMKDDKGYLKIRQDDMFYAVINAIKELDKTIQQIVEDVKTAIERLNSHDKEIKKLQQENEELKARIEKLEKLVK